MAPQMSYIPLSGHVYTFVYVFFCILCIFFGDYALFCYQITQVERIFER